MTKKKQRQILARIIRRATGIKSGDCHALARDIVSAGWQTLMISDHAEVFEVPCCGHPFDCVAYHEVEGVRGPRGFLSIKEAEADLAMRKHETEIRRLVQTAYSIRRRHKRAQAQKEAVNGSRHA